MKKKIKINGIFLLIIPVFVVMYGLFFQVSDGEELLPDVSPTTITVEDQCSHFIFSDELHISERGSGVPAARERWLNTLDPRLSSILMYNGDDILISQYEQNMRCELAFENDHGEADDKEVEKAKIQEKYLILIDKAHQQNIINRQKQKQIDQHNEGVKMNRFEIVAASLLTIGSILILCVYAYFRRRHLDNHKFTQDKEEREYNLKVKELELKQTLQLQQAELEKHKTFELSKIQMDNEHEAALKKIEFDKSIDARDFMFTVTKEERDYLLKQRELDIKEGKSSPSFMDIIDSNKDVQLRLKK
jgi:hypothetical protein